MGRVDDEKGEKGKRVAAADYVDGTAVFGMLRHVRHGLPAAVAHSSVWFRNAAGFSPNDANNLFANFYFGGFGNNYVDYRDEKRYREFYSFPGAGTQRYRRPQLREDDGGMEPAAVAVRERRDAGLLPRRGCGRRCS